MNPAVKREWVNALRHGNFYQAHERLCTDDGAFDPLGVLCELFRRDTGRGKWERDHRAGGYRFNDGVASELIPPPQVRRWAGMKLEDVTSCLDLNDYYRKDLNYIADTIERDL
jgi:hypothetical protein